MAGSHLEPTSFRLRDVMVLGTKTASLTSYLDHDGVMLILVEMRLSTFKNRLGGTNHAPMVSLASGQRPWRFRLHAQVSPKNPLPPLSLSRSSIPTAACFSSDPLSALAPSRGAPWPRSFVKKCSVSGPCSLVGVAGAAGGSAAMPSRGAPSPVSTSICMLACEESDGEVGSVPQHVDFKTSMVRLFAEVVKFGCIPSSPRRPSSSSLLPAAERRHPQVRLLSASDPFDLGPPFRLWS
jgi:hypothetical protein